MTISGRGNKVPRKIFTCQYCSNEFSVNYIGQHSKKMLKTCSECISLVRRDAAVVTNNGYRDLDKLLEDLKKILIEASAKGEILNLSEASGKLKCSTKTLLKAMKVKGTTFKKTLEELGLHSKGMSKFQKRVLIILHELFPDVEIISEKTFDGLVNPETNCNLRIDFYIPILNIAIECDGNQHNDPNHYFNTLTIESGYTPSYITDPIKESFCQKNNIRLVRIPYKKVIVKSYIQNLIM